MTNNMLPPSACTQAACRGCCSCPQHPHPPLEHVSSRNVGWKVSHCMLPHAGHHPDLAQHIPHHRKQCQDALLSRCVMLLPAGHGPDNQQPARLDRPGLCGQSRHTRIHRAATPARAVRDPAELPSGKRTAWLVLSFILGGCMQLRQPLLCVRPTTCHQVSKLCRAAVCPVKQQAARALALHAQYEVMPSCLWVSRVCGLGSCSSCEAAYCVQLVRHACHIASRQIRLLSQQFLKQGLPEVLTPDGSSRQ